MTYDHLGRTGLKVSRLGLGTMNFGWVTDEPTAFAILDRAVEEGINFVDTADVYGGPQSPDMERGYGLSEEIIGRWLARGGGRRDRIVLATKLYQPMGAGPNDKYLSAYKIRKAAEDSLRRLRTDHLDLYQMHHVDRSTPWDSAGFMVFGYIGGRTAERWSERGALAIGIAMTATGSLGLLTTGLWNLPLPVVLASLFVLASGVAFAAPPTTSLALAGYPELAGTASSVLGCARFGLGGVAAPLVGLGGARAVLPLGIVTVASIALAAVAHAVFVKQPGQGRHGRGRARRRGR
ncbi:aldo/keto reductase [Streptomyces sp. NPDC020298]|uniref:aldo/keto reductase n=1 Tax=unclassified Streptomyces TaxID=2593676 RepID=UPI0033E89A3B